MNKIIEAENIVGAKLEDINYSKLESETKKYLSSIKYFEIKKHTDVTEYRAIRADVNSRVNKINRARIDINKKNTGEINKYAAKATKPLLEEINAIDKTIESSIVKLTDERLVNVFEHIAKRLPELGEVEFDEYIIISTLKNRNILDYKTENWSELLDKAIDDIKSELTLINKMKNATQVLELFNENLDMNESLDILKEPVELDSIVIDGEAVAETETLEQVETVTITYKMNKHHQKILVMLKSFGVEYNIKYEEENK